MTTKQKWEYMMLEITEGSSDGRIQGWEEVSNELGENGWELVCCTPDLRKIYTGPTLIFKRLKE